MTKISANHKKSSRKEHYDTTKTVAQNLTMIQDKYSKINGITSNEVLNNIIAESNGRVGPYTSYNYIGYEPNAAANACGTQWEQVPVTQAWDGSWLMPGVTAPNCPTDYYGAGCNIYCEPGAGCNNTMTDDVIKSTYAAWRAAQCAKQNDANGIELTGNAKYCDDYTQWNPKLRFDNLAARNKRFADQLQAFTDATNLRVNQHAAQLQALTDNVTKQQADLDAIKVQYDGIYNTLVDSINAMDVSIADNQKKLLDTQASLLAAKIAANKAISDAEVSGISTNIVALQEKITILTTQRNTLQAAIDAMNLVLVAYRKRYTDLTAAAKAAADAAAAAKAIADKAAADAAAAKALEDQRIANEAKIAADAKAAADKAAADAAAAAMRAANEAAAKAATQAQADAAAAAQAKALADQQAAQKAAAESIATQKAAAATAQKAAMTAQIATGQSAQLGNIAATKTNTAQTSAAVAPIGTASQAQASKNLVTPIPNTPTGFRAILVKIPFFGKFFL